MTDPLESTIALVNGKILTLNDHAPTARAMAVAGEKITRVGEDAEIRSLLSPATRVIDLQGKTVVPGFIDSHIHLAWFGSNLLFQADLNGSGSVDEILGRLADMAGRTSGWVRGHGFDDSKLSEGRFPTRAELDRVSRDRPIVVSRVCGHAGVANSAALALLSPEIRAAGDESSGRYTEGALWAIYDKIPPLDETESRRALLAACAVVLKTGITSVQTLLDVPEQMIALSALRAAGRLPIRVVAMPPWGSAETLHRHGIRTGFGDDWLRFGAVKLFSDGSLGARTAWLAEPYADAPETRGTRIYEPKELIRRTVDAHRRGFQVATHAIGDQAVRETLDAVEAALGEEDNHIRRHRIEHVSVCPRDCIERLARRKVVVTLQPQFVVSDTWTPERIGARARDAYPFKSLLAAGVPIALSSDCPVEWPSAFACLAAAVGGDPWRPGENLSPVQAIDAYCRGSAYAGHAEGKQGSLEVGKLADFVVLSADPTEMTGREIAGLTAEMVFVGGRQRV